MIDKEQFREEAIEKLSQYLEGEHILRPRQVEVIQDVIDDLEKGNWSGSIKKPTGAGKSVMQGAMSEALDVKTLILVPTKALVDQTKEKLTDENLLGFDPDKVVAFHSGEWNNQEQKQALIKEAKETDTLIMTYSSFVNLFKDDEIHYGDHSFVILDESHKAKGEQRLAIMKNLSEHAYVQAWTATDLFKENGEVMSVGQKIFGRDDNIHSTSFIEATEHNEISPAKNIIFETDHAPSVRSRGEEYTSREELTIITQEGRDEAAVNAFAEFTDEETGITLRDEKSVWYTRGIENAKHLASKLNEAFGDGYAAAISGKTPADEQDEIFKAHKEGKIRALVNSDLLIEGYDDPSISVSVMLRPTKSPDIVEQAGGRATRLDGDNPDKIAYVISFVDKGQPDIAIFGEVVGTMNAVPLKKKDDKGDEDKNKDKEDDDTVDLFDKDKTDGKDLPPQDDNTGNGNKDDELDNVDLVIEEKPIVIIPPIEDQNRKPPIRLKTEIVVTPHYREREIIDFLKRRDEERDKSGVSTRPDGYLGIAEMAEVTNKGRTQIGTLYRRLKAESEGEQKEKDNITININTKSLTLPAKDMGTYGKSFYVSSQHSKVIEDTLTTSQKPSEYIGAREMAQAVEGGFHKISDLYKELKTELEGKQKKKNNITINIDDKSLTLPAKDMGTYMAVNTNAFFVHKKHTKTIADTLGIVPPKPEGYINVQEMGLAIEVTPEKVKRVYEDLKIELEGKQKGNDSITIDVNGKSLTLPAKDMGTYRAGSINAFLVSEKHTKTFGTLLGFAPQKPEGYLVAKPMAVAIGGNAKGVKEIYDKFQIEVEGKQKGNDNITIDVNGKSLTLPAKDMGVYRSGQMKTFHIHESHSESIRTTLGIAPPKPEKYLNALQMSKAVKTTKSKVKEIYDKLQIEAEGKQKENDDVTVDINGKSLTLPAKDMGTYKAGSMSAFFVDEKHIPTIAKSLDKEVDISDTSQNWTDRITKPERGRGR